MPRNPRLDVDRELLRCLYVDEMWSTDELCAKFHMNCTNLSVTLDFYGIPRRHKRGPRTAKHHGSWSGGRIVDKSGYILVYMPEHPHASHPARGRCGYVREHRLVMEKMIGRYLDPKEVVHHKNGKKDDNRPENLELFSSNAEHLKHELTGRVPQWTEDGKRRIREGCRRKRTYRPRSPIRLQQTQPCGPALP